MKKLNLSLLLFLFVFIANAQNASVEQSIFGIQTGLLGIWVHHEYKLTDHATLRTELGFDAGLWGGNFYEKTGFVMAPVISVEPRWYYNLNKRERKEKRIDGNSGNFLSLKTVSHPNWFVISNYDNLQTAADFSIVPTWGVRRNIGKHFNYEAAFGVGYGYIFAKQAGGSENVSGVAYNIHLRIGYRF